MELFARRHKGFILGLSFLLLILLFLIVGCWKDDDPPTYPLAPVVTYPSVAGRWLGNLAMVFTPNVPYYYTLRIDFTQAKDSLAGSMLYTVTGGPTLSVIGQQTSSTFIGTIKVSGEMTIAEKSFVPLNWDGANWRLKSYSAVLSSRGDTLTGKVTSDTLTQTGGFGLGKQ